MLFWFALFLYYCGPWIFGLAMLYLAVKITRSAWRG